MQINDIAVSVERLDDVRGGASDIFQLGAQVGYNQAGGFVSNAGVLNQAQNKVAQDASQHLGQGAKLSDVDIEHHAFSLTNSILGGYL